MRIIHTWTRRLVTGVLTAALMSGGLAWADGRGDTRERLARQAMQSLATERDGFVEITLSDGTRHQGRLESLGEHSFLLVDRAGQMRQVPYRQVSKSGSMSAGQILIIAGVTAGIMMVVWCSKAVGNPLCIPTE
jgi:hypothetical protein